MALYPMFPLINLTSKLKTSNEEFRAARAGGERSLSQPSVGRWCLPAEGLFKVNSDASVRVHDRVAGLGFVVRDHLGAVIASGTNRLDASLSPQYAETLAIKLGAEVAIESGLCPVLLKSDASFVIILINNVTIPLFKIGFIV
ncbi:hypothetical protein ACOSQ2_006868 [Xanthoceras sorbifolium]